MLQAQNIRKSYGGVVALAGVDITVKAGSIHALLGENGAGKSTLVKILVGALHADSGTLRLDGKHIRPTNTANAVSQGIAIVSQELSLFPDLDALANLFPMRELRRFGLVDRRSMRMIAEPVLAELGLHINLDEPIGELPLEQQQLLEIARALCTSPRVLVLDEPTSALHDAATQRLHAVLRRLSARGVSIIYVSHHLEDVLDVCDTVTVLRDGLTAAPDLSAQNLTVDEIVAYMLGDKKISRTKNATRPAATRTDLNAGALEFSRVTVSGHLEDVSLIAPSGSIIGLAGVAGAGHRAVLGVAAGVLKLDRGHVTMPGGQQLGRNLRHNIGRGLAIVSGDRRRFGVMLDKPIWENIAQVRVVGMKQQPGFVIASRLRERAQSLVDRLGVKASSVDATVGTLSGGNQQKVVFAKWLDANPKVILLDDPTRGIDIGAKAEIYAVMGELAQAGAVQIIFSSDPLELAAICDEVAVFYEGHLREIVRGSELTAHNILEVMNTGNAL